jgi:hypothetical protein
MVMHLGGLAWAQRDLLFPHFSNGIPREPSRRSADRYRHKKSLVANEAQVFALEDQYE